MSSHKTINPFNSPLHILKVHRNSTRASMNQSTCLQRTSRTQIQAQVPMAFTHAFPATMELPKITMTSPRTKAVNNFSKFQAVQHHQPQQAINNSQARRVIGIFHLITLLTTQLISILPHTIITIQRYRMHTTDTISIRATWARWIRPCWIITACCKITTTIMVWVARFVGHFCQLDYLLMVSRASLARVQFNCGNSFSNFSPISHVRVSLHGLVMAGNLNSAILMRWDIFFKLFLWIFY